MGRGYWVRRFPSATGHVWFQVMSPLGGRVYESTDAVCARERCDSMNAAAGFTPVGGAK